MDPLGVWNEGVERNNPPKWKDPQDKGAFMWRRETSHIHSSGLGYDAGLRAGLVCWRGLGSNSATAKGNEKRKPVQGISYVETWASDFPKNTQQVGETVGME